MIVINSKILGASASAGSPSAATEAVPDLTRVAGRFGLFPAGDMPVCADTNTAMVGFMQVDASTRNNPLTGDVRDGIINTIYSAGAGQNGQERIPETGTANKQWVIQLIYAATGALYNRRRINTENWSEWAKRW